tara:strand:+ start:1163 stop:2605 length:1443 start_codon:yes stop_codon:yes gene_type:complete
MVKKIFYFFLTISSTYFAQTPCNNGMAGEYPCNGYDLMARIPVSVLANTDGNPEGSDIWGWTDTTTNKEYAIAAMTNSTAFVDISDPLNPLFLGRLDSSAGNSFWRDVKIYNNHAFIVADNVGAHGMQVFDLTKLRGITTPQTFVADKLYSDVSSCHNIVINETNGIAYLVDCKNTGRGIHFVDISDPINPINLGNFNDEGTTHDAQVVTYKGPDTRYTDKEILIGSNETKVVILDVTDKNNIEKISSINYTQLGYTHQGWFTEDQRYFILGDETDEQNFGMNTRTLVFDFNDLENPILSSTYSGPSSAIDHNGYVKGNEFFMASYRAGIRVLDITNIGSGNNTTSMTETGYFDTYPANNGTAFNGAWSIYPYFSSDNLIINDIERGLLIIRKSGTLSIGDETLEKNFSISPNPMTTETNIRFLNNETIKSIKVYTVLGQKIFEKNNINQARYVLTTNSFKKGIYIIKINSTITKKIVVK